MKCESVACVWSGVPSLHGRVTASAVLNDPPTLYTGGSDGSIIWWHLSSNQSNQRQKIWPMAVLCGHTAAIADLEICSPIVDHVEREGTISNVKSIPAGSGAALISACVDGVLCIWSRGSGHCKRRRKLPPWVGTPAMMSSLPMSPRYVCIGCNCVDTSNSHAADGSAAASQEANGSQISNEAVLYRDGTHSRRTSNCAAIIVDSCTLNILQTIYHGSLFLGRLKFMAAVPFDKEKQLVIMADTLAKVESFVLIKEIDGPLNEGTNAVQKRPLMETSIEADSVHDRGVEAISVSRDGKLLAFIFRTRCIFWHMTSGIAIGEISSMDTPCLKEEGPAQGAYIKGGTFLQSDYGGSVPGAEHHNEGFLETFAVWSNKGSVIIYTVSGSRDTFHFEPSCEIPAISHQNVVKLSVSFIQLNTYLLRVESICFDVEGLLLWKPNVSIWSLGQSPMLQPDVVGKLGTQSKVRRSKSSNNPGDPDLCIMLGEGGFLCDWIQSSFSPSKADENSNSRSCVAGLKHRDCLLSKQQIVSSSLILSNDFDAPYAVVYGFFSGQIEVVRFGMFFNKLSSVDGGNLHHNVIHPHQCEQYFSGHTGAILCLAAHRMVGATGDEGTFKRVLISGSLDCTICIWDLDTGNLISKMHHHVGPVRQIILAPPCTDRPWNDCFLSVGEDLSVALASLETLRVERMFPGHPSYPELVVWDSARGYIACLCLNVPSSPLLSISSSDTGINVLYIWDVKTGAQERALRGTACRSMFDHFCRGINVNPVTGNILGGTTSASSLALPIMIDDASFSKYHDSKNLEKGDLMHGRGKAVTKMMDFFDFDASLEYHASKGKLPILKATGHDFTFHPSSHTSVKQLPPKAIFHENEHNLIKCSCPFPGIATLKFNLSSLMHLCQRNKHNSDIQGNTRSPYQGHDTERPTAHFRAKSNDTTAILQGPTSHPVEEHAWDRSLEGCLLQLSLSFLHLWGVDHELDKLLIDEMNICKPESFIVASGLVGDRGSLTLAFPGQQATIELWKTSSEFCAMRALTMVSLAQRVISLSRSSCAASSALAAFYTRNFVEKVPDIKPPLLQLLVSFWQDPSEHVRMAARSLFHCAASRAIPLPLCSPKRMQHELHGCIFTNDVDAQVESSNIGEKSTSNLARTGQDHLQEYESSVLAWLESYEVYDWISCVGGTNQDAMSSHIVVAGALAVWYPSLVKPSLAVVVVHPLLKLVMAMNDKYSATAAELLAEGMESTWKDCIGPEIPRLIGDIFFQIECVSSTTSNTCLGNPSLAINIRDTLVGILLPSLAMADIPGFLNVIESQIWANASDSPVHIVSLMTLIRVARGSPKHLALHVDKVLNFILQTMDPANSVMRKTCLNSSMAVLRELMRVFPMIGLNETSTQLAVGDAVGDIRSVTIRVYDIQSATKVKVLDASGPPGLPSLLGGTSETMITTAISALSFSPDGEGLVAFSEQGLMIRWWSLGTAWWEKLSRSYVPVQCTKLIFVPPWEGFSPSTSRSSMMASIIGHHNLVTSEEKMRGLGDADSLKLLINNLDLFYQLEWTGKRKVKLVRHGHELGSFQL